MSNGYAPGSGGTCGCMPGSCNQGLFDGGAGCCSSGCSSSGCCSEECCDSQYGGCGGCGGCCVGNYLGLGNSSQFFATADYLNVHASFSEATAFVHEDLNTLTDNYVPLDYNYNSSFRVGGGWKSCCCGDQIRVMYTQMTSDASATGFPGDIFPVEPGPQPGGQTNIRANVDARTIDVECAKTIPLGGQCCGCGDSCGDGCCDQCCSHCPAWDITWSGGIRWADVGWQQSFVSVDSNDAVTTDGEIGMNFRGGGLRTGLEGRRYFFKDGWLSIYAKGDLSLLLGDVNISSIVTVPNGGTAIVNTQTYTTRQIIPVTELEAGLTGQLSSRLSITAGYLFAAWHDLGTRQEHTLVTLQPIAYDDANILGFDGFFARAEFDF
jgi:hypothetical protein